MYRLAAAGRIVAGVYLKAEVPLLGRTRVSEHRTRDKWSSELSGLGLHHQYRAN